MATKTIDMQDVPEKFQQKVQQVEVKVTHRCVAKSHDVQFVHNWLGMEIIPKAGTIIAYDAGLPVQTPYDECVLIMPSLRHVLPGVTFVRLGQQYPI
jgi:hypothetical protein